MKKAIISFAAAALTFAFAFGFAACGGTEEPGGNATQGSGGLYDGNGDTGSGGNAAPVGTSQPRRSGNRRLPTPSHQKLSA